MRRAQRQFLSILPISRARLQCGAFLAVAVAHLDAERPLRFDPQDTGQLLQSIKDVFIARLGEGHRQVITLRTEEVGLEHEAARIDELQGREQQPHRKRDAAYRDRGAARPARNMPHDHVTDRSEPGALSQPLCYPGAINRWRRR